MSLSFDTVHLRNHVHSLCFVVFCYSLLPADFTNILQGHFTGTGAVIWLSQCQWGNPEKYGWIGHMNPLRINAVVAKNVGHVGHCRRHDPNVRWVLCKHQTICPTAQAKTWLLRCLQSRKNCQSTSCILLNEVFVISHYVLLVFCMKKPRSKPCFNRWAKMGVIGSHGHKRYSCTVQISFHSGH